MKKYEINFYSELEHKSYLFKNNKKDLYKIFKEVSKETKFKGKFLVSINLFDSKKIKEYNYNYRNKDSSTDVLSFPNNQIFKNEYDLGDIFINGEILEEQANSINSNENMEFKFLFLHGILHLIGYDHIEEKDEEKMIKKQKEILKKTKIRDEKLI